MRTDTGDVFHLSDYRPTDFVLDSVNLTFRLDPQRTEVVSTLTLRRRPGVPAEAPLVLDGDEVSLKRIDIDGIILESDFYVEDSTTLTISDLPSRDPFALTLVTEVAPAENTQLMGLYQSSGVYTTQCEAEGFRRITFFPDRPDVLAIYTTRIEAPKHTVPLLLSNGNLKERGEIEDGRHYRRLARPPPQAELSLRAGGRGPGRRARTASPPPRDGTSS